jgi:acyl-coenzyme A thioesterase PaaI-like protein
MNMSDGKKGSGHGQRELTKLQKDGIAAKLANNPVVKFMSIGLREVTSGEATLILKHREELRNSMGLLQGRVVHSGRRIAVCQVEISSDDGVLLATGVFTYMVKQLNEA